MQRERVSENVYWFQSDVYAQVTAGVITGPQWAVVIDTLALPDETLAMRSFIEEELSVPVRYIINTHNHADHTWGNCFFPGATIIAHSLTGQIMAERGQTALEAARKQNPAFKNVKIVLPHLTFDEGQITLRVGKKNLVLFSTPGHSRDGISILVEEDRVLFAGDAFMPIPYVVDGSLDQLSETMKSMGKMGLENIIQGHGDIILRGEIDNAVKENVAYLSAVRKSVKAALKRRNPLEALSQVDIAACGKSRVYLGGLAEDLHRRNLRAVLKQIAEAEGIDLAAIIAIAQQEQEYEEDV
ncbi:MBL fold metallo-hydrolase [Levilinea saccharolytica]|uniref:MBL fold metallo-hydrolase n=1 Tax=Levilinea saccharolytica TaxID=229921 RepID=UPI0007825E44|nr:MBL fold metallo-hydrolase [Levilinea saccharolytica]GAP17486.1 Zn-dependent hydrolase [Levilinea saccharolytica]